MTELKLCKDCKWYKKNWIEHLSGSGDQFDKCMNPILNGNLVTGKYKGVFCDTARNYGIRCGKEGRYWEAK